MISFLWYGRKIIIPGVLFVMSLYAGYLFFLIAGKWPWRAADGSYLSYAQKEKP